MEKGLTLFITGGAGYVGAMLAEQFAKRPDVHEIICLDKEPEPEIFVANPKITWISANTSDGTGKNKSRGKILTSSFILPGRFARCMGTRRSNGNGMSKAHKQSLILFFELECKETHTLFYSCFIWGVF